MHLKTAVLSVIAMLLIGTTSASADGPAPLTYLELEGVTVAGFMPDPLRQLRIAMDSATDDADGMPEKVMLEQLEAARSGQPLGIEDPSSQSASASSTAPGSTPRGHTTSWKPLRGPQIAVSDSSEPSRFGNTVTSPQTASSAGTLVLPRHQPAIDVRANARVNTRNIVARVRPQTTRVLSHRGFGGRP